MVEFLSGSIDGFFWWWHCEERTIDVARPKACFRFNTRSLATGGGRDMIKMTKLPVGNNSCSFCACRLNQNRMHLRNQTSKEEVGKGTKSQQCSGLASMETPSVFSDIEALDARVSSVYPETQNTRLHTFLRAMQERIRLWRQPRIKSRLAAGVIYNIKVITLAKDSSWCFKACRGGRSATWMHEIRHQIIKSLGE